MLARLVKYCLIVLILLVCQSLEAVALTRLTNNDPYPLYSTNDPYDFLTRSRRNELEDYCEESCNDNLRVSFSVFRQSAVAGGDLTEFEDAELGDLKGRWNMLGPFYDPHKRKQLIRGLDLDTSNTVTACQTDLGVNLLTEPAGIDREMNFGFLSVPILYRKYGSRLEAEIGLPCDFTIQISGGVSHIFQEPDFIDFSCTASGQTCPVRNCTTPAGLQDMPCPSATSTCCSIVSDVEPFSDTDNICVNADCCINIPNCLCKGLVMDRIINQKQKLERLLGLDIDENLLTPAPFSKTGFEDIEVDLNWARMYPINKDRCDWPFTVITPFASFGFTIPSGKQMRHNNLFALPFGNDGHWSYGGRAGVTFDFVDAFEIGGDWGITGFAPKVHTKFPAPTNELQSGVFPELTTMRVQPGFNWHFAAYLNAYRFLDRFSAYVQYMVINHDKDDFDVVSIDERPTRGSSSEGIMVVPHKKNHHKHHERHKRRILTKKLHNESEFRIHIINGALNYEISPNIMLGIVWQIPLFQQNGYRSTTVLGSFNIFF